MAKVRFVKISSFYPEVLNQLYLNNPNLKDQPYRSQYKLMMDQGIGWADYWIINLNKTNSVDAELFIINNEFAQKMWAKEHGFKYNESNWQLDILTEQIRMANPEIVFANDYVYLDNIKIRHIRRQVPGIRKVFGWDGLGLWDEERFSECDELITCGQHIVDYYQSKGKRTHLFQFGFEKTLLEKIDVETKKYDISFTGSLTLRKWGHHKRLKLLGAVAKKYPVNYWLSSFDTNKVYMLKNLLKRFLSGEFSDIEDILRLWFKNRGVVYGLEMYQVLAHSRLTLNSHIDTSLNISGNIRLWEATGVGTCLVTDWKENLDQLFIADEEIIVYRTPEECLDKIKYLLQNPKIMEAIARAGQKRTLNNYSYEKRMADFLPILLS